MFEGFFSSDPAGITLLLLVGSMALAGWLITLGLFAAIGWYGRRRSSVLWKSVDRNLRRPTLWLGSFLFALSGPFILNLEPGAPWPQLSLLLEILLYAAFGWVIVEGTDVLGDLVRNRYRIDVTDNLEERKIITQFQYIKKVAWVVAVVVTLALILLQFEKVREIGAGILTSAGVAGIIIGLAAQKSIANLLAGFQLAFTQPIRLDDVVIVEGEWGRIEDITLTYVVIRIWDERRLIVPLNYFNEKPFQNWTRESAQLLGTVYLYADYRLPVEQVRSHFYELLEQEELWDGRVKGLQVTDADRQGMELRFLMSARNASEAWELRCRMRERLVAYVQEEFSGSLPRTRLEWPPSNGAPALAEKP